MALPKSLYSTGLENVASRWLKNTEPVDQKRMNADLKQAMVDVAEALMIAPRVCFRVYGENIPLALLVRMFGVDGVEKLLWERAIEFHLYFPSAAYIEDTSLVRQGQLNPLVIAGTPTTAVHADPEASAQAGLTGWAQDLNLDRKARRHLIHLAAKRTSPRADWVADYAVERVYRAYNQGEIESLGFDPEAPLHELTVEQRSRLCLLANQLATTADLLEKQFDYYQSTETWNGLLSLFNQLLKRDQTRAISEQILTVHHLPSIPRLLTDGVISVRDILTLRNRKECHLVRFLARFFGR